MDESHVNFVLLIYTTISNDNSWEFKKTVVSMSIEANLILRQKKIWRKHAIAICYIFSYNLYKFI